MRARVKLAAWGALVAGTAVLQLYGNARIPAWPSAGLAERLDLWERAGPGIEQGGSGWEEEEQEEGPAGEARHAYARMRVKADAAAAAAERADNVTAVNGAFGDNMVLQRGPQLASVYGRLAEDDANVRVRVTQEDGAVDYEVVASLLPAERLWVARLQPSEPSGGGNFTLRVSSAAGLARTLRNVTFGDVFLCAGQSNMALPTSYAFRAEEVRRAVAGGELDAGVRLFSLGRIYPVAARARHVRNVLGFEPLTSGWLSPSQLAASGRFQDFASTALYFALRLAERRRNATSSLPPRVPVGVVVAAYGGTSIESWLPRREMRRCGGPKFKRRLHKAPPSVLYNGMIGPLLHTTLAGVLWYQGENNVFNPGNAATAAGGPATGYACLLPALVETWRQAFAAASDSRAHLPFFLVTLAPGAHESGAVPRVRAVQLLTAYTLPDVHLVHAYDLGDPWPQRNQRCERAGCCPSTNASAASFFVPAASCMPGLGAACAADVLEPSWCAAPATPKRQSAIHPRTKFRLGDRLAAAVHAVGEPSAPRTTPPRLVACRASGAGWLEIGLGDDRLVAPERAVASVAFQTCNASAALCGCSFWEPRGKRASAGWACAQSEDLIVQQDPEQGWLWQTVLELGLGASPGTVRLRPAHARPLALRYAWSDNPCCDQSSRAFRLGRAPCPPQNCPVRTAATDVPPDPFFATLRLDGSCEPGLGW